MSEIIDGQTGQIIDVQAEASAPLVQAEAWRPFVDEWQADITSGPDAVSEATAKTYRRFVARFLSDLPAGVPVTARTVRRWLDSIDGSAATVNLHLAAVRSLCRWLIERELSTVDPTAGIRGRRRHNATGHKRDELTADEVRAVLGAAEADASAAGLRDSAILALMAYCALRTIEVQRAEIGHLQDKSGRRVLFVHGKARTEADAFVVLPPEAEAALRAWQAVHPDRRNASAPLFVSLSRRSSGKRLSSRGLRQIIRGRYQAAGVDAPTKTAHSLRHSAISTAIRNGATPMQAQQMARHANLNTTMIYVHQADRLADPAELRIRY